MYWQCKLCSVACVPVVHRACACARGSVCVGERACVCLLDPPGRKTLWPSSVMTTHWGGVVRGVGFSPGGQMLNFFLPSSCTMIWEPAHSSMCTSETFLPHVQSMDSV